jgi:hypothetical protein
VRHLLRGLALLSVTPVALALPVVSRAVPRPHPVAPKVAEHPVAGVDPLAARTVPGYGRAAGPVTARPLALTRAVRTASFSALGLTWNGGGEVEAQARVRQNGAWSPWHALDADDDHGPDATVAADNVSTRAGSAPWFTGPADGYQVRVGVLAGRAPSDVRVSLVDPGTSPADGRLGTPGTLSASGEAAASAPQPAMISRRQWGADERLRSGTPDYGDTIKMGFVHHTDTSNSYTPAQAAAMVRSVYAFHTKSRGWSDIGYNFLVDKYGRVFEGRYGGVDRPVIGAHTGGFNTDTFGVSLLGTYTSAVPSAGQLAAVEKVFAWKFGLHYVNPYATSTLTSAGGSKYAKGKVVTFANVSGHRDAGLTSCPGEQTYRRLPAIRSAIKSLMGASLYGPTVSTARAMYLTTPSVTVKATIPGSAAWRLVVRNGRTGTVQRTVTGSATGSIGAAWNLRDNAGNFVTPDRYALTLESWNAKTRAYPFTARVDVVSALPSGIALTRADGTPYAMVDAGRVYGVSPALGAALRQQPSPVGYYGSTAGMPAPAAPPRDGMFVKSAGGTNYVVVDGWRRPVSASVVSALGLTAPRTPSDAVLALLPVGPAWTDTLRHPDGVVVTDQGVSWRIEGGVRRPFTSPAARAAWSKSVAVAAALPGDLARPVGTPLAPPEGVVLRTGTGAGVVSGGTFRALPSPTTLYDTASAAVATADDLAALPAGDPVAAGRHPSGALVKDGTTYYEVLGTTKRAVDATLLAADPRVAVAPAAGETKALTGARWLPPSGVAGRAADGTIRVVASGRLVTLPPAVANALGYSAASLPALEASDFGPLPAGAALADPAAHPAGTVVRNGSSWWLVDAGTRRPLAASLVPTWVGRPALPATSADLALPLGPAAPPGSGAWLVTPDKARWLVDGGVRRSVPAAVAHRLGLDLLAPIPAVLADLTAATKSGPAVP